MRVVAGIAKGRRLQAPAGRATRPTSDRVREAIFSSLGTLDAVADARVLDLFAGSGALGIEALSRGAAAATFVDDAAAAIAAIRANLAATQLDGGTVVRRDVLRFLADDTPTADLVLVDPPYAFARWDDLLALLPPCLAVLESDRDVSLPEGWASVGSKRYGGTVVTLARRQ